MPLVGATDYDKIMKARGKVAVAGGRKRVLR